MKSLVGFVLLLFFNFQTMFGQDSLVDKHRWEFGGGCNYFPIIYLDLNYRPNGSAVAIKYKLFNKIYSRSGFSFSPIIYRRSKFIEGWSIYLSPNLGMEFEILKLKKLNLRIGIDSYYLSLYRWGRFTKYKYSKIVTSNFNDKENGVGIGPIICIGYNINSRWIISSEIGFIIDDLSDYLGNKRIMIYYHRGLGINAFYKF